MLWARTKPVMLYISPRLIGIQTAEALTWLPSSSVKEGLECLADHDVFRTRQAVRVWLDATLAVPLLLTGVDGLTLADRKRVAESMAAEVYGLTGPLQIWVEDSAPKAVPLQCVASAMESQLWAMLNEKLLGPRACRLLSLAPWWAACLDHVCEGSTPAQNLVVLEPCVATIVRSEDKAFHVIETSRMPVDVTEDAQHQILARACIGAGVNPSDVHCVTLALGSTHPPSPAAKQGLPFMAREGPWR